MGLKSASPEDDVQGDGGWIGMLGSSVTSEEPVKGQGRPWVRFLDIKPRSEAVKAEKPTPQKSNSNPSIIMKWI